MSTSMEMPKYKYHKEVWALKIEKVKADNVGRTFLHFADERYAPIEIANGWLMKHMPVPGGYYVQYEDGYASYSPAEAFESGYSPANKTNQQGQIELLTAALDAARHELDGKYITSCNGKIIAVDAYQLPPAGEKLPDSFVEWCDKVGFTDYTSERDEGLDVHTLKGPLRANPGDWIVKINGEFFPDDAELFAVRYTSAADLLK